MQEQEIITALKEACTIAGSQIKLSTASGVSQAQISDYLCGRRNIRNMTIGTFLSIFPDIDPNFFGEEHGGTPLFSSQSGGQSMANNSGNQAIINGNGVKLKQGGSPFFNLTSRAAEPAEPAEPVADDTNIETYLITVKGLTSEQRITLYKSLLTNGETQLKIDILSSSEISEEIKLKLLHVLTRGERMGR